MALVIPVQVRSAQVGGNDDMTAKEVAQEIIKAIDFTYNEKG